jgi:hypothetical protein
MRICWRYEVVCCDDVMRIRVGVSVAVGSSTSLLLKQQN